MGEREVLEALAFPYPLLIYHFFEGSLLTSTDRL